MEYIDWSTLILDLILTIIFFLFIPVFIRIFVGKLNKSKAKKIAIANAIIVQLFIIILASANSDNPDINFFPAFLWGSVGYYLLSDNDSQEEYKEMIFCPHCNYKNKIEREYCVMCGKNLNDNNNNNNNNNNNKVVCSNCKAENSMERDFCYICSERLKKDSISSNTK